MKKLLLALFIGILFVPILSFAQTESATQTASPPDEYYRGRVLDVRMEDETQYAKVVLLNGPDVNSQLELDYGTGEDLETDKKLEAGDRVVLSRTYIGGKYVYNIYDKDRINQIAIIAAIFFVCAVFFGRLRGFTSIIGMALSLAILTWWVIPQILAGANPLVVSLIGAGVIAVVSLYIAHGFNKRTSIALAATLITLSLSAVMTIFFVWLSKLSGTAQEEAVTLHVEGLAIDLKGLLLGGIIIGALGILDDITTAQVAVVDEIHKTNSSLSFSELYKKGLSVGHEHIASLINTLVLAYAGASFPLLLLFAVDKNIPMWVTLNSEFVAEEVIRTLAGSITLVFAVPIATFLAVYVYKKMGKANSRSK